MFYSDYVANHIYSATLDTGGDVELLLNDSVEVPGMNVVVVLSFNYGGHVH